LIAALNESIPLFAGLTRAAQNRALSAHVVFNRSPTGDTHTYPYSDGTFNTDTYCNADSHTNTYTKASSDSAASSYAATLTRYLSQRSKTRQGQRDPLSLSGSM
jgi:hypothetical protein